RSACKSLRSSQSAMGGGPEEGKLARPHRLAWTPAHTRAISTGSTTFAIRRIQPPLFTRCQPMRIWVLGFSPYADPGHSFSARPAPAEHLGHLILPDVSWIVLDAPARRVFFLRIAGCRRRKPRSPLRSKL